MNNAALANTTLLYMNQTTLASAATANITTLNSTICTLSPHARALSSVLTGFVGTILTGLTGGYHVAFMVGWVSWFALLRNIIVGVYQVHCVVRSELPEGGEHFFKFLDHFYDHDLRGWSDDFFRGAAVREVSAFGWVGWMYTTLYSPTIQVLWLVENWGKASSGLNFARAIGVGVAALPSTFDTRARYAKALDKIYGWHAAWLFAALTAASTVILTAVAVLELGLAASGMGKSAWIAVVYVAFTVI